MRILGLDPGTAITGYGILDEDDEGNVQMVAYGLLTTQANTPFPERLLSLYQQLNEILQTYRPDGVAIEELFFGKNVTTGIKVAQARGVLVLAVAQAQLPLREYKPNTAKISITGYGGADKTQMQEMMRQLLNLDETPRPDDAADGLALAYADLQATRFDRLSQ
jgi:crossover junction endodeoxyribonuclease RuvC